MRSMTYDVKLVPSLRLMRLTKRIPPFSKEKENIRVTQFSRRIAYKQRIKLEADRLHAHSLCF
jgi:hypothetical protein